MVDIRPFRGTRYDVQRVGSLSMVTCPPYDVISEDQRKELSRRSEYNMVRLVLGEIFDTDDDHDNRYIRSAWFLREWQQSGVLKQDALPAIYAYEQQFCVGETQYSRLGFIAAIRLQDFSEGGILPHERTLSKPKKDRLSLMRATKANLSPIFGIYSDEKGEIDEVLREYIANDEPDTAVDDTETVNRIWPITDQAAITAVRRRMCDCRVLIADGHHRYETCLDYRREVRDSLGLSESDRELACDFTVMMLVNMHAPGLVVFPTHRVVYGVDGLDLAALLRKCASWFDVEQVDPSRLTLLDDMTPHRFLGSLSQDRDLTRDGLVFGLYMSGQLHLLKLQDDRSRVEALMDPVRSDAWRRLDVSVLHSVVISRLMGISESDQLLQRNIRYTRSLHDAVALVDSGQCQAALLMDPPSVDDVRAVADSGETMPQKSTYFYPKLLTGLVLRMME